MKAVIIILDNDDGTIHVRMEGDRIWAQLDDKEMTPAEEAAYIIVKTISEAHNIPIGMEDSKKESLN